MPKPNGNCDPPSNFDDGISVFPTTYHDEKRCVTECSDAPTKCLKGSKCMTAPKDIANGNVKMTCLFEKSAYEQPAFDKKDKECQPYENYSSIKHIGLTYGSCLPPQDKGSCPNKPDGFKKSPQKSADGCELPCND